MPKQIKNGHLIFIILDARNKEDKQCALVVNKHVYDKQSDSGNYYDVLYKSSIYVWHESVISYYDEEYKYLTHKDR